MGTQMLMQAAFNCSIHILAPKSGKFTGLTSPEENSHSLPDWYLVEVW
jgi:hypothetical protein